MVVFCTEDCFLGGGGNVFFRFEEGDRRKKIRHKKQKRKKVTKMFLSNLKSEKDKNIYEYISRNIHVKIIFPFFFFLDLMLVNRLVVIYFFLQVIIYKAGVAASLSTALN